MLKLMGTASVSLLLTSLCVAEVGAADATETTAAPDVSALDATGVDDKETGKEAKDIFLMADEPKMPLGVKYQILLKRGHEVAFVSEKTEFKSGDKFRVLLESNQDGYAYLFNRGTSGNGNVLYPDPRISEGANSLKGHTPTTVPSEGWFQFDETPGIEKLYVFFSAEPLEAVDEIIDDESSVDGKVFARVTTTLVHDRKRSSGRKDIVFVAEEEEPVPTDKPEPLPDQPRVNVPPPQAATTTYVGAQVGPGRQNMLIHTIKLTHNE